jgi:CelD/BcsL family acetyltransferase involved in cellulose biosynthesis
MYRFKVNHFDPEELDQKFKKLSYVKKSFFYEKEWLYACASSRINKKNIYSVEIYLEETILMIMLFEKKNFLFCDVLTWLFAEELNFATPILFKKHDFKKQDLEELIKKILHYFNVDLLLLDKNPIYIENELNPLSLHINSQSSKILKIDLKNKQWDEYYQAISSNKTRQTDRRKEKLLLKEGKIEIQFADNVEEKKKILDFTIQNKISFLKKKNLNLKNFERLYSNFFNNIINNPKYICTALKIDNKIISSIIGRIEKKRYYYLMPSYLEKDFTKYSPGRVLLKEQIKWCFEKKIEVFDFGPGYFDYKNQWANSFESYFKILVSKTFLGHIFCIFYKFKKMIQGFLK